MSELVFILPGEEPEVSTPKLVDRIATKVDRIRQRVNVDKVGVRRYHLYRVIRTWDGDEVGDGDVTVSTVEITPAPAITLGKSKDSLNGRGRVEVGSMFASEVSLTYSQSDLMPTLTAGQELYYKLVEMNTPQGASTTYWILTTAPEADRCETPGGNAQWLLNFTRAQITE